MPVHWPQVVDIFAFLAVPMWMLRHYVKDPRLKDLWLATAPFIIAALLVGVWRENRIFGELSAIIGLTFALQLEQVLAYKGAGDALPRTGLETAKAALLTLNLRPDILEVVASGARREPLRRAHRALRKAAPRE